MANTSALIVGGGVLGTMHALSAVDRGYDVIHVEREPGPRGASVRNFGLVWVSGRASGAELSLAIRARERWESIAERSPTFGFRANGSITLAKTPEELSLMEEACAAPDAEARGFSLLEPAHVQRVNPALRGSYLAGLHCDRDAGVEPRQVPLALRSLLESSGRYRFVSGREIRTVSATKAIDQLGAVYRADRIIVCTGAAHSGLGAEVMAAAPLRRVRLQMFETAPLGEPLTTSLADGDSLRYYPAFDLPGRQRLGPQAAVAEEHHMQLLCQQRLDGSLTVGDTHAYDEPFAFDLDERPTDHLVSVLGSLLGRPLPPIVRRWSGVYSQLDVAPGGPIYFRASLDDGVELVTGPGGRGMTLSPAIAEETFS
jgi:FAD dependent oxidoreductase TIGR03364